MSVNKPQSGFVKFTALFTIFSLIAMTIGVFTFTGKVEAASLTNISDTLSDSDLGIAANHTIVFTPVTDTLEGTETLKIQFDPATDFFGGIGNVTTTDITFTGATVTSTCGAGTDEVTMTVDGTAPDENLLFTVCTGDSLTLATKTIVIGNTKITNPASAGSYVVRINWNSSPTSDTGDTRVAIIDDVVVTAAVDTNLTFIISGMASTTGPVNGETLTIDTTTTTIPFGTLTSASAKTGGQQLKVTTNAVNGFVVTVKQDQNLTSANGADIDLFDNGTATPTPVAWVAPSGVLDSENTYGHYGVTSDDDLNSNEFGTQLFAGNIGSASRQVFSHTGAADGSTQNKGLAKVAYKIQITDLQEAATDYTNTLTYVCTPTF